VFINGFCACSGTDPNKPALSCNKTLLILKEKPNFFIVIIIRFIRFVLKGKILIVIISFVVKDTVVQNIAWG